MGIHLRSHNRRSLRAPLCAPCLRGKKIKETMEDQKVKADVKVNNMALIAGGSFLMGSDKFYPEEKPVRRVTVDGFYIDKYAVTNEEYKTFVDETAYITVAERPLNPADYPGAKPELLVPGALVFQKSKGPVDLSSYFNW